MIVKCLCCYKNFEKRLCDIKKSPSHYCSRSCAAKINNKLKPKRTKKHRICNNCKLKINGQGKTYCSIKCQQQYNFKKKINNWKNGLDDGYETNGTVRRYIKRYLIKKNNHKCSECGWNKINPNTNKCPLEIHHIDGNYKNNNESNLQVLCPNCHSLTNTYKNMNKGNGRECRK